MKLTHILAAVCVFLSALARADEPFVDPYSVASPSGEWVLNIRASNPDGAGVGSYRMLRGGEEVWKGILDHTLRECIVSDEGVVIGYAYATGYMGWGGELVVMSLGPDGSVLANEKQVRETLFGMTPNPPGYPRGAGVFQVPTAGHAVVRVIPRQEKHPIEWWMYDLKDGSLLQHRIPESPQKGDLGFAKQIAVRPLPGLELALVHWYVYEGRRESAFFELLDAKGKSVWSRKFDDDYAAQPEYWNWSELISGEHRQIGAAEGEFEIVSFSERRRFRYRVQSENEQWTIEETGSEPAEPVWQVDKATPELIKREARTISEITLQAAPSDSTIASIRSIQFNGRGRIGWVRAGKDVEGFRFTLIDQAGAKVADLPLTLPKVSRDYKCAWLGGDRWVIAATHDEMKTQTNRAWFLDIGTGALQEVPEFRLDGSIDCIRADSDGGFVVLSTIRREYTLQDQITWFGQDGRFVEKRTQPGYGRGDSIEDIAVLTDGRLAVLVSGSPSSVKIYKPGEQDPEVWGIGALVGELAAQTGYFPDLCADRDGGLILQDSSRENLLHRIDRDGKRWQSFHVQGHQSAKFRLYSHYAVDPEGRVWAHDGTRLFRCDEQGKPDLVIGGPETGTMDVPVALTMDAAGSIYALERGTAAVHIFDADGKPQRTLRPPPEVANTQDALAWIQVLPSGGVRYRVSWEGPILTFNADGEFAGAQSQKRFARDGDEPIWTPVSGGGWEQSHDAVRRLGPKGMPGMPIETRPSGAWLVAVEDAAAAPDGSLAVLSERSEPGLWHSPGTKWLCAYGPDGSGRGEIEIPGTYFMHVMRDDARIMVGDAKGVTVFDPSLKPRAIRYDFGGGENTYWETMLRSDGTVATWASGARTIQIRALD